MCYPANTYLFQLRNLLGKGIEIRSLVGANILILDKGYFLTSVGGKQVTCLHHRYTTAIRSLVSRGSHLLRVFHEHIDSVYYFFKLISFFFFFFFWPHWVACGILVLQSGSNSCPLQWKYRVLTTGPPGKSIYLLFILSSNKYWWRALSVPGTILRAGTLTVRKTQLLPLRNTALSAAMRNCKTLSWEFIDEHLNYPWGIRNNL